MSIQIGTLDNILAQTGPFPRLSAGSTVQTIRCKVKASQTIKIGDLVSLDASGNIQQCLADPGSDASLTTSSATSVYGIALENITTDASGNYTFAGITSTEIDVALADGNTGFFLRLYNATAANTSITGSSIVRGTKYQFGRYRVTSGNLFYVLLPAATTTPEMQFDQPYDSTLQGLTDLYAIVKVHVVKTYQQGDQ